MTNPTYAPLAYQLVRSATKDIESRYSDPYRDVFRLMRQYSVKSIIDAALVMLWRPRASIIEELESLPWATLLLVKWAIRDGNINLWAGRRITEEEFDYLKQLVWNLQDVKDLNTQQPNVFLMLRKILPTQLEFQRNSSWEFLRWPTLISQLPKSHRLHCMFEDEFGMSPTHFIDLSFALYAATLDRPMAITKDYFQPFRTIYGESIDKLLAIFSRSLMELRTELQSEQALKSHGSQELHEFPYFKRYPLIRMRDSSMRCWHPTVFSRGLVDMVHLRLTRHGHEYTEAFGRIFEKYVLTQIDEAGLKYINENIYWSVFGKTSNAVEAIIPGPVCNILIEAKMGIFGDEVLHTDRPLDILTKTRVLREAARQALNVINNIDSRPEALPNCRPSTENYLLVVTSRELHVGGGMQLERIYPAGRYIFNDKATSSRLPLSNIFYVEIGEFERLMGCVASGIIELGEFLRDAALSNQDMQTAKPFLSDFLGPRVRQWPTSNLINQAQLDCQSRLTAILEGRSSF